MSLITTGIVTKGLVILGLIGKTLVNPFEGQKDNLVDNGEFEDDSIWVIGGGWTISAGVAHNDGTIGNLTQVIDI